MTSDESRPTLPDGVDVDRLPDDVLVYVVSVRNGHRGRTHLFPDCQAIGPETTYREARLGDRLADRDAVCQHCRGVDLPDDPAPTGPYQTLQEEDVGPADVGLSPLDPDDDDPDDPLVADGGQDVNVTVSYHGPGDHSETLEPGDDPGGEDPDGEDGADDRPACDYGSCTDPAIEVYHVDDPAGALRMRACPDHAPTDATPVDVVDGGNG